MLKVLEPLLHSDLSEGNNDAFYMHFSNDIPLQYWQ